jgi:hypothetical protein
MEEAKWKQQERIEEEHRLEAGKFFVFTLHLLLHHPLPERLAEEDRPRPSIRYLRGSGAASNGQHHRLF